MYKSPIEITNDILTEITKDAADKIVAKARTVLNIKIDKDELVKALEYDRNQYDKGFKDGYEKGYNAARDKFCEILENTLTVAITESFEKWTEESEN